MRYSYVWVEGHSRDLCYGLGAIVKGVVLYDKETHFEFFLSRDHRLRATGWVFGGIPISLVPDESAWDVVCRYTLGVWDSPHGASGIDECGCGMLHRFRWEEMGGGRGELDGGQTRDFLMAWLEPTTAAATLIRDFEPLMQGVENTDYDCACQMWPDQRRRAEVHSAERASDDDDYDEDEREHADVPDVPDEIMSDKYESEVIYEGFSGYHSHHGAYQNRPLNFHGKYRVGVELEVECKSGDHKERLNEIRSNWFYQERDGSLSEDGVELITVPLRPEDAHNVEFWRDMTDVVKQLATSWENESTGLHVHFSNEILGDSAAVRQENLGKLLYFWHHIVIDGYTAERKNADIYGRARCYNQRSSKTDLGDAGHKLGAPALRHKDVTDQIKEAMIEESSDDRYCDINITNEYTIEFRKGKGSIKPERIAMVVAWSELMCHYVCATKWENLSFDGFRSYVRDSKIAPDCLKERV